MSDGEVRKMAEWSSAGTMERGGSALAVTAVRWSLSRRRLRQPRNTLLAAGSPWLCARTEAKMRNNLLSGLDLLNDLPWSVISPKEHVWVSGPEAIRGHLNVHGPSYHLMPCGCLWSVPQLEATLMSVGHAVSWNTDMSGLHCT